MAELDGRVVAMDDDDDGSSGRVCVRLEGAFALYAEVEDEDDPDADGDEEEDDEDATL